MTVAHAAEASRHRRAGARHGSRQHNADGRAGNARALAEDVTPRILYSADAAVLVEPVAGLAALSSDVVDAEAHADAEAKVSDRMRIELVVVDRSIDGADALIEDFETLAGDDRRIEILEIPQGADGLQAIGERLAADDVRFDAIHIVSHGDGDGFALGSRTLDAAGLREAAAELADWGASLADSADLLIYGCDLASTEAGRALLGDLAALTGADVAASVDATGAATLGGDWDLEYAHGDLQSQALTSEWRGLLTLETSGGETRVNNAGGGTHTPSVASSGQVATNGTDTVVVWENDGEIRFRIYGPNDSGGQQLVENTINATRTQPAVAINANGDFVIVWTADNGNGGTDIYGQRFNPDGTAVASPDQAGGENWANANEFRINAYTAGDNVDPAVAMRDDGAFLVSWTADRTPSGQQHLVSYQLFGASGAAIVPGVDNLAGSGGGGQDESESRVTWNTDDDGFAISYLERNSGREAAQFRFVQADGTAAGHVTMVNPTGSGDVLEADLAFRNDGLVTVGVIYEDGGLRYVLAGTADIAGGASSMTLRQVNGIAESEEASVAIATDADDRAVVVWSDNADSGSRQTVYASVVGADGTVGNQVRVPESDSGNQLFPSIAIAGHEATVVWSGNGEMPGENDSAGTFIRTLATTDPGLIVATPSGTTTNEDLAGTTIPIAIQLATRPSAPVTVTVTSNDTGEGTVAPASFLIDDTNWTQVFTATVTAVRDGAVDGDAAYDIIVATASGDPDYDGLSQNVTVTNVDVDDEAPTGGDTAVLVQAGGSRTIALADLAFSHPGGETAPAAVRIVALPVDGSLLIAGAPASVGAVVTAAAIDAGDLVFVAPPDATGTPYTEIKLMVRDSTGLEAAIASTVAVDANAAPDITSDLGGPTASIDVDENSTAVTTVQASDVDGPALTYSIIGGADAAMFTIGPASGALAFASAPDFESPTDADTNNVYEVQVQAADGNGGVDSQTITVNLQDVIEAPVSSNGRVGANAGEAVVLAREHFPFVDPQGALLERVTLDTVPVNGVVRLDGVALTAGATFLASTLDAGRIDYLAPDDGFGDGYDALDFTVRTGLGLVSANNSTLFFDVNGKPVFSSFGGAASGVVTVPENQTAVTQLAAEDPQGELVRYRISAQNTADNADRASFTVDLNTGQLAFAAAPDFETPASAQASNTYRVMIEAYDPLGVFDTQSLVVAITNVVEDIDIVVTNPPRIDEDQPVTFGTDHTIEVQDGEAKASLAIRLTVDTGRLDIGVTPTGGFIEGDGQNDAAVTFVGSPAEIRQALDSLTYTPDADHFGSASLRVQVLDPGNLGRFATSIVTITIDPVNDAPALGGSGRAETSFDRAVTIDSTMLSATDVDNTAGQLTYRITREPEAGELRLDGIRLREDSEFTQADIDAGRITYVPTTRDTVVDVIRARLADGSGAFRNGPRLEIAVTGAPPVQASEGQDTGSSAEGDGGAAESPSSADASAASSETPGAEQAGGGGDVAAAVPPAENGAAQAGTSNRAQEAGPDTTTTTGNAQAQGTEGRYDASTMRRTLLTMDTDVRPSADFARYESVEGPAFEALGPGTDPGHGPRDLAWLETPVQESLQRTLAESRAQLQSQLVFEQRVVASSVAVSTGVTIGYVIWLIRGGALLSSIIASMPAWRSIDPLPVLQSLDASATGTDGESIESMLDAANREQAAAEAEADDAPEEQRR